MKKNTYFLLFLSFLCGICSLYAQDVPRYVPNQMIILFKQGTTDVEIANIKTSIKEKFPESITSITTIFSSSNCGIPNLFVWQINGINVNIINIVNDANGRAQVSSCDPNYVIEAITPINSSSVNSNFELLNTSCRVSPTTEKRVKVGFADTGLDGFKMGNFIPNHTLFQAFGSNVKGVSMISGISNAQDDHSLSHGTHVVGIFAQICSLYQVQNRIDLRVYKTQEKDGSGSLLNLIRAFDNALCEGVNVMNLSLSWNEFPFNKWSNPEYKMMKGSIMERVFDYIGEKGMLVVGAAGNAKPNLNVDFSNIRICPAVYKSKNLIVVNATKDDLALADFSNYGLTSVDISTPGYGIKSTVVGTNQWGILSGTSMATPQVTAEAVILGLLQPSSNFSYQPIKDAILNNITPKNYLNSKTVTGGMANICDAINNQCLVAPIVSVIQPTCTTPTGTIKITTPLSNVDYSFDGGLSFITSNTKSSLGTGIYSVRVRNTVGCVSNPTNITITAPTPPVVTSPNNVTICRGTTTTLTANGGGTYIWNTNANTAAIIVSPSATTTYTVTVTGTNGCKTIKSAIVTVNALPVNPTVKVTSALQRGVCTGIITVTAPTTGVSYIFDNNPPQVSSSYYTMRGAHNVKVKNTLTLCESAAISVEVTPLCDIIPFAKVVNTNKPQNEIAKTDLSAIEEQDVTGDGTFNKKTERQNAGVTIFPNPVSNEVSLDLSSYEGLSVSISFYNSIGSLVLKEQTQEANATTYKFDVNALPIGSYLIRLQAKDKPLEVKRFIIVR